MGTGRGTRYWVPVLLKRIDITIAGTSAVLYRKYSDTLTLSEIVSEYCNTLYKYRYRRYSDTILSGHIGTCNKEHMCYSHIDMQ